MLQIPLGREHLSHQSLWPTRINRSEGTHDFNRRKIPRARPSRRATEFQGLRGDPAVPGLICGRTGGLDRAGPSLGGGLLSKGSGTSGLVGLDLDDASALASCLRHGTGEEGSLHRWRLRGSWGPSLLGGATHPNLSSPIGRNPEGRGTKISTLGPRYASRVEAVLADRAPRGWKN